MKLEKEYGIQWEQMFLTMSTTLKIERHTEEANKLRIFQFTLSEDAKEWFYSLPVESITTWEQMETTFMNEYFPALVVLRKRYDINELQTKRTRITGD